MINEPAYRLDHALQAEEGLGLLRRTSYRKALKEALNTERRAVLAEIDTQAIVDAAFPPAGTAEGSRERMWFAAALRDILERPRA